jgi:Zn-dependent M28 family amino/carboxypeptidase
LTSNRTSNKKSQIFIADWNHKAAQDALGLGVQPVRALPKTSPEISVDDLRTHLTYLASDELEGRLTGTEGERKATEYAAKMFEKFGLEPGGDGGGWYQEFEFTAGVDLGPANVLKMGDSALKADEDWRPLAFSSIGEIEEAGVVFAGYGMEVPEEQGESGKKIELYSSYFHLDVKDKWVLMFRYMPENVAPELRRRYARHSSLRFKALTARQKGARGIIVVSGPTAQVKSELVPLSYDASMADSGVSAISVTNAVAQKMLDTVGKNLKALQEELDGGEMAAGITLTDVSIGGTIDITQEKRVGRNVLGRLKSNGGSRAPLVIGAHIDHLGAKASATSRSTDEEGDQVHHGADDNASGTSGLFEIAEYLSAQKSGEKLKMQRDVIFAAWSGEELGLLGSNHYVRALAKELEGNEDAKLTGKLAACLNMDMIGRMEKSVVLQGIGSSKQWKSEIERRNVPVGLPIVTQDDAYLPTDATSFYLKGVPILNAFTGSHEDYHKPSDTPDKIDYENTQKITRFMALVARGLTTSETEPVYEEMKRPEEKGARTGLRAYLGTVPDYAQGDVVGVKLSGVTKGAPADKAGLKGGDVIIKLAGKELKNIYDYTYIIEALKIGTEVDIEVKRGDDVIKSKITPGSRE